MQQETKFNADDVPFDFLRSAPLMRSFQPPQATTMHLELDTPVYRGVQTQFESQPQTSFGSEEFWETGPAPAHQSSAKTLSQLIPMPSLGSQMSGKVGKEQQLFAPLSAIAVPPVARRAPVPPMPAWIEPYSSFSSTSHDVLDQICQLLEQEQIHYNFKPHKNKIKGIAFENDVSCQFVVQLYARDAKVNVCEFQRKRGCCLVFNRLYRRIHSAVTGSAPQQPACPVIAEAPAISPFLEASDALLTPASFSASPSDHSVLDGNVQLDEDTLSVLSSLAASPCLDIQRDAARTVAHLSACPVNAHKLAESVAAAAPSPLSPTPAATAAGAKKANFVELVQSLLSSKDREVARCASVLVANLSKEENVRGVLIAKLLSNLLRLLDANADAGSMSADTSRQCAAALENLASSHAPQIVQQLQRAKELKRAINLLEALQNSKDRVCRDSAGQALNRLVLVGVTC